MYPRKGVVLWWAKGCFLGTAVSPAPPVGHLLQEASLHGEGTPSCVLWSLDPEGQGQIVPPTYFHCGQEAGNPAPSHWCSSPHKAPVSIPHPYPPPGNSVGPRASSRGSGPLGLAMLPASSARCHQPPARGPWPTGRSVAETPVFMLFWGCHPPLCFLGSSEEFSQAPHKPAHTPAGPAQLPCSPSPVLSCQDPARPKLFSLDSSHGNQGPPRGPTPCSWSDSPTPTWTPLSLSWDQPCHPRVSLVFAIGSKGLQGQGLCLYQLTGHLLKDSASPIRIHAL